MLNKSIKYLLLTTGLATALLMTALTSPLNATTLTIHQEYAGWTNSIELNFDGSEMESQAGENSVYFNSNTSNIAPAYCVDLSHTMHRGENTVDDMVSPSSYSTNGIYVEWLMKTYSGATGLSAGTGLQLAIWEVLYDFNGSTTGYGIEYGIDKSDSQTGNFFYTGLAADTNGYINAWYDHYISGLIAEVDAGFNYTSKGDYVIVKLSNGGNDTQDLITLNPVPEPATMALFGIGLLGIALVGRKRN